MRTLIHGATVVPGAGRRPWPRASILIENGRIVDVGPRLDVPDRVDRVLDGRDRIVVPGLVNGHGHSHETYHRGHIPPLPMELWALRGHPVLGVGRRTPEEVYWRTLLPCLEMLRNGVTTVIDDLSLSYDYRDELVDAVMQAYDDSGLRAWVSVKVMDRPLYETLPVDPRRIPPDLLRGFRGVAVPTAGALLAFSRRQLRRYRGPHRLARFSVNPSAPQRCSDRLLRAVHRLAQDHGFPYVLNVQETRLQAVQGPQRYGTSMIAHLGRLGLLSPITTVMQGVWVDRHDADALAGAGATVVHNPASNLRCGSGISPLRTLLEAGVAVGLGCDGPSSNDGQSVLEAMKLASTLSCVARPDHRDWITPAEAFRMGTEGGARSALLGDAVGTIEAGKRADLVLLDRRAPAFAPLRDVVAQLVYAEAGHAIRTVLVDGRVVVDDGRVLTADLDRAVQQVQAIGERLSGELRRTTRIARRLEPLWTGMVRAGHAVPLESHRLLWRAGDGLEEAAQEARDAARRDARGAAAGGRARRRPARRGRSGRGRATSLARAGAVRGGAPR